MVYEATSSSLVSDVLMGYNATVFAYGATGSGKTHTMVGSPQQPGIMVRALNDLFQAVKDSKNPEQFTVSSQRALKCNKYTGYVPQNGRITAMNEVETSNRRPSLHGSLIVGGTYIQGLRFEFSRRRV
jgi:hypothetical protein